MADEVQGVDPQSVQQATQVIAQNLKQLEAYRAELRKVAEVEREVDLALGRVTKSQSERSKALAELEDQIEKARQAEEDHAKAIQNANAEVVKQTAEVAKLKEQQEKLAEGTQRHTKNAKALAAAEAKLAQALLDSEKAVASNRKALLIQQKQLEASDEATKGLAESMGDLGSNVLAATLGIGKAGPIVSNFAKSVGAGNSTIETFNNVLGEINFASAGASVALGAASSIAKKFAEAFTMTLATSEKLYVDLGRGAGVTRDQINQLYDTATDAGADVTFSRLGEALGAIRTAAGGMAKAIGANENELALFATKMEAAGVSTSTTGQIFKSLAMVTGKDDDGVFPLSGFVQIIQDSGKLVIDLGNHGVVGCLSLVSQLTKLATRSDTKPPAGCRDISRIPSRPLSSLSKQLVRSSYQSSSQRTCTRVTS